MSLTMQRVSSVVLIQVTFSHFPLPPETLVKRDCPFKFSMQRSTRDKSGEIILQFLFFRSKMASSQHVSHSLSKGSAELVDSPCSTGAWHIVYYRIYISTLDLYKTSTTSIVFPATTNLNIFGGAHKARIEIVSDLSVL